MATPPTLPDLQNQKDARGIALQRVGITNVLFPIKVRRKGGGYDDVSARTKLFVGLPHDFKGANLSRFMECLVVYRHSAMSSQDLPELLKRLQESLQSNDAYARFEFDYYIDKQAPVTGKEAPMAYRCALIGIMKEGVYEFVLEVNVTAASLCPCSREMSLIGNLDPAKDLALSQPDATKLGDIPLEGKVGMGAHNQRSRIRARIAPKGIAMVWIEDLILIMEACASAPTYPILKRPDEKFVTEQAYNNAKFSEDITRDLQLALEAHPDIDAWSIRVYNEESIHPYDVSCYQNSTNWKHQH